MKGITENDPAEAIGNPYGNFEPSYLTSMMNQFKSLSESEITSLALTMDSSGNVGIGTPVQTVKKLEEDAKIDAPVEPTEYYVGSSVRRELPVSTELGGKAVQFYPDAKIKYSGKVGVRKLQVD
jgi:hypothetical protein